MSLTAVIFIGNTNENVELNDNCDCVETDLFNYVLSDVKPTVTKVNDK